MESLKAEEKDIRTHSAGAHTAALAEENRKLQEMLRSALGREADALKRVKHLSDLLTECRAAQSGSPGSAVERTAESCDGRESDPASGNSQCSRNTSPTLVVSPPFTFNVQTVTDEAREHPFTTGLYKLRRNSVSSPNIRMGNGLTSHTPPLSQDQETEQPVSPPQPPAPHSPPSPSSFDPTASLPFNLLAPQLATSNDVRKEREKLPPLLHCQTSPEVGMSGLIEEATDKGTHSDQAHNHTSSRAQPKDLTNVTGRSTVQSKRRRQSEETGQQGIRARASSILKPSWLRRRRNQPVSEKSLSSSSYSPTSSVSEMFQQFVKHSSHIKRHPLAKYIDCSWSEVTRKCECSREVGKYRNAMWELFQAETKYLCYQLQPLEQVYKAFLEEVQFYGVLQVADMGKIFSNLSELVELSASIAKDLFLLFDGRSGDMIAPSNELILAFSMFGHKWNPVYQRFCVNMERQRGFVKALHQLPEFVEYLKVCRGHKMVQRSDLADLLIAPMQHQVHYKLMLENVLKATTDPSQKSLLSSAIKAFVVALKELEANIAANHRSEELLELQETLQWPPLSSLSTDSYIPECLSLDQQRCQDRLATPDRHIVLRGSLQLLDARARPLADLQIFLLTDMVLLTQHKNKTSKKDLTCYRVYHQPLFLHQLDVLCPPFSPTYKHTLTFVQRNDVQQQVSVYSLQASTREEKERWVTHIQQAQEKIWHTRNADTIPI